MSFDVDRLRNKSQYWKGDELISFPDIPRYRGAKRAGVHLLLRSWCLMRTRVRWLTLAASLLCAACLSHAAGTTSTRLDRSVITRDQMLQANYSSVYDAVAALRSLWLQPRTPDNSTATSVVWVYVDNARVGDVGVLRTM